MKLISSYLVLVLAALAGGLPARADPIQPLQIRGEDFVNPGGKPVRFWGVNLVAFYPPHEVADKVAANLAEREINLVRPHHMLRPSTDWVVKAAPIVALQDYKETTRKPDPEAWDRFDYLNAALRKNGIYLMLAVWWTRNYLPGDVDVLHTNDVDRKAWMEGIKELNSWHWQKGFDVRKMLCVVDERVAALEEEFARQLLTHVNPYTHLSYAQDPQVLTLELINESSTEYNLICNNRFPEYFQKKLVAKWEAFARGQGIEPGDLYKPADARTVQVRAKFFRKLDEDYLLRMKGVVQNTGSKAAVTFSNLWRGDNALEMEARHADYLENHMYGDPLVAGKADDFISAVNKTAIAGKPLIVGELNQAEGAKNIAQQSPMRSMLPVATSAYGLLQNWSGVVFFAWTHGDKVIGPDGWAENEGRESNIGQMVMDGMQLDHLRTCGLIFRRGLVAPSANPITIAVDEPFTVGDYHGLMRGKYPVKAGWQDMHGFRRTFGPVPAGQADAPWLKDVPQPENLLVSDTKQIIKDIERKQLTVAALQAEAFSGYLDGKAPAGLKHLEITGDAFATVVLVAEDKNELANSAHLIISRTNVGKDNRESDGPAITLTGMKQLPPGQHWEMLVTRPRDFKGATTQPVQKENNGSLVLPNSGWHECELIIK